MKYSADSIQTSYLVWPASPVRQSSVLSQGLLFGWRTPPFDIAFESANLVITDRLGSLKKGFHIPPCTGGYESETNHHSLRVRSSRSLIFCSMRVNNLIVPEDVSRGVSCRLRLPNYSRSSAVVGTMTLDIIVCSLHCKKYRISIW